MNFEKFFAESMSDALLKIEKKLGPEAIIYSHSTSEKGVEVIAGLSAEKNTPVPLENKEVESKALNFLEQVAGMDPNNLQGELVRIEKINLFQQKLRQLKFPFDFIDYYSHLYAEACSKEDILSNEIIIKLLFSHISLLEDEIIDSQKICALIGPTGIGKSTSIAKIAKRFAAKYGSRHIGIISTDFQRIITKNQFHYFSKLLDIDVKYARNSLELKESIYFFSEKKLTLIDTAGLSPNDNRKLAELLEGPCNENKDIATFLVLPCNLQSEILNDVVENFRMSHTLGCILTKKDESKTIAPCLSVVMRHQLPIAYWCDGQNIATDIHAPNKIQLINAVFQGEKVVRNETVSV